MDQSLATARARFNLKSLVHCEVPMERHPSDVQQTLFFSASAMGVEAIDDCEHTFANDHSQAIAGLGAAVVSWCVMVERALWMI
jgi:hypothetical protein